MLYNDRMKTTVEIRDSLYRELRRFAAANNLQLRQVIEEALKSYLSPQKGAANKFKLKIEPFDNGQLKEGLSEDNWAQIRRISYGEEF
jgi:predicted transcriptional regulator